MPDWSVYQRYQEKTACAHAHQQPTQAVKSNGVICVYIQCCDCGEKITEAKKSDYDVPRLPCFNEKLRDSKRAARADVLNQMRVQWQEENDRERQYHNGAFWDAYNLYLASPHWQQVRRRVIARDNFRCQGCFCKITDTSAHVHHLSYDGYKRLGKSFPFECVALCRSCHTEFHGE